MTSSVRGLRQAELRRSRPDLHQQRPHSSAGRTNDLGSPAIKEFWSNLIQSANGIFAVLTSVGAPQRSHWRTEMRGIGSNISISIPKPPSETSRHFPCAYF